MHQASWTLHKVARALLLFFDGITKLNRAAPEVGELPTIDAPRPIVPQLRWTQTLFTKYRMSVVVSNQDLERFRTFYSAYSTLIDNPPGFLSNALGRFGQATSLAGSILDLEARFVHYIRSLEALLGTELSEIARTLALRTAALLGGTLDDYQETYDFIKAAYKWRSRSVHGDETSAIVLRGSRLTMSSLMSDVDLLHWYCRKNMQRAVDLIAALSVNEPFASTWRRMSDSKKKEWVCGLLDLALLRDDVARLLEGFFNGTATINELTDNYEQAIRRPFNTYAKIYYGAPIV